MAQVVPEAGGDGCRGQHVVARHQQRARPQPAGCRRRAEQRELGGGWVYVATFALQLAVLTAAVAGRVVRVRPLLVARYYVLTTASMAAGLWDYLRHGTPAGWTPPEGTR